MFQYLPIALIALGVALLAKGAVNANKEGNKDDKKSAKHGAGGAGSSADRQQRSAGTEFHRQGSVSDARLELSKLGDSAGDLASDNRRGEQDAIAELRDAKSVGDTGADDNQEVENASDGTQRGDAGGSDHGSHVRDEPATRQKPTSAKPSKSRRAADNRRLIGDQETEKEGKTDAATGEEAKTDHG